ncbi:unnamed protein product [Lepidochelys olivacea]
MNASKAIAGDLKIVHEMNKSECLASIHLNVTEPAPAPASLARVDRLNGMAAGDAVPQCLTLARAALSQQAGDAGPMQELAELMQPEDASGGDRSAVLNGKLLGSAEMLNDGGLESGAG